MGSKHYPSRAHFDGGFEGETRAEDNSETKAFQRCTAATPTAAVSKLLA
jgi:hypothetical protein